MFQKSLLILIISLILTSCGFIAKKMYDIKNPKKEDKNSILKFLEKNNIENKNVFIFDSLQSMQEYFNSQKLSVPEALFLIKKKVN